MIVILLISLFFALVSPARAYFADDYSSEIDWLNGATCNYGTQTWTTDHYALSDAQQCHVDTAQSHSMTVSIDWNLSSNTQTNWNILSDSSYSGGVYIVTDSSQIIVKQFRSGDFQTDATYSTGMTGRHVLKIVLDSFGIEVFVDDVSQGSAVEYNYSGGGSYFGINSATVTGNVYSILVQEDAVPTFTPTPTPVMSPTPIPSPTGTNVNVLNFPTPIAYPTIKPADTSGLYWHESCSLVIATSSSDIGTSYSDAIGKNLEGLKDGSRHFEITAVSSDLYDAFNSTNTKIDGMRFWGDYKIFDPGSAVSTLATSFNIGASSYYSDHNTATYNNKYGYLNLYDETSIWGLGVSDVINSDGTLKNSIEVAWGSMYDYFSLHLKKLTICFGTKNSDPNGAVNNTISGNLVNDEAVNPTSCNPGDILCAAKQYINKTVDNLFNPAGKEDLAMKKMIEETTQNIRTKAPLGYILYPLTSYNWGGLGTEPDPGDSVLAIGITVNNAPFNFNMDFKPPTNVQNTLNNVYSNYQFILDLSLMTLIITASIVFVKSLL